MLAALLCVVMVLSLLPVTGLAAENDGEPTTGVTDRGADPNTTDSYMSMLLGGGTAGSDASRDGARYAGRIWSDKTVIANKDGNAASISLDMATDGSTETVSTQEDFLHVFSVLGSNQVVNGETTSPLDVVILLDISTSMTEWSGTYNGGGPNTNDNLHKLIDTTNTFIDRLMGHDADHTVHPLNRVGVVVYGGGSQTLLPLNHYSPKTSRTYLSVNDGECVRKVRTSNGAEINPQAYFSVISTNVNESGATAQNRLMIADATYLQGALYDGMTMLAKAKDPIVQESESSEHAGEKRTPILIVMTDGATNMISATSTNGNNAGKIQASYNWYEPFSNGVIPHVGGNSNLSSQYSYAGANPFYADCNNSTGQGLIKNDKGEITARNTKENRDLEIQAIAPRSVSNLLLAGYLQKKIEANYGTDMQGYSLGFRVEGTNAVTTFEKEQLYATLNPAVYFGDRAGLSTDSRATDEVTAARKAIDDYISKDGTDPNMRFPRASNKEHTYTADQHADFTWSHPTDSETYDVTKFEDVYYIDKYYTADDADELERVFDQIFEIVNGTAFTIVAGQNAAGADDLTYMDPIGDYMEVKSIDNLLLFGNMYNVVQTAVYDYTWNSAYMTKIGNAGGGFTQGWYTGETGDKGAPCEAGTPGAVYRLDFKTTQQFVPTLEEKNSVDDMDAKQQHTVYTMYRLAGGDMEIENTRRLWRLNPAYAGSSNLDYNKNTYVLTNQTIDENDPPVGAYRLSDIRMWVEDTGNWRDDTGVAVSSGYSEALWVNIPANAVPVQLATVTVKPDKSIEYKTNLGGDNAGAEEYYKQSTPLRVFYSVGVEDSILYDSNNIDLSQVDATYIDSHTIDDKDGRAIFFRSNYWTETKPDQGDAALTFSPGTENRYYLFQRPLPLYKITDDGAGGEVTIKGENTVGVEATLHGEKLEYADVSDLTAENSFYIVVDYYRPKTEGGGGELVHLAVARKGSDFGSGILGPTDKGAFLCWLNLKDNTTLNITERETGGEDGDNYWVVAAKPGGLRTGNLNGAIQRKNGKVVTKSANDYYYPTIAQQSETNNIIVSTYLGNNGWLRLQDTQLLVTKTVLPTESQPVDPNEPFDFQVFVEGVTGTVSAVVVQWDDFAELWRRRIGSIDVITGNAGYAQGNGTGEVTTVDYDLDGDGVDENYVVYLGNNTEVADNTVQVYSSKEDATPVGGFTTYVTAEQINDAYKLTTSTSDYAVEDATHPAGTRVFWCEAYLYDTSQTGYNPGAPAVPPELSENFTLVERFPIATMYLDEDYGLRSGIRIESPFAISWQYMTKKITFGASELYDHRGFQSARDEKIYTGDGDELKSGTATFTLRDGEGLLFTGLPYQADYRVTERLTQEQASKGYTLKGVEQVLFNTSREFSLSDTKIPEDQWPTSPPQSRDPGYAKLEGGYDFKNDYEGVTGKISEPTPNPAYTQKTLDNSAYFDAENNVYSVFKDTSTAESAAHFTNTFAPKTLTIAKELSAAPGAEITDEDKNTPFYFSAEIKLTKDPAEYPVTFPLTRYKASGEPYPETEVLPQPAAIDLEDGASENDLPKVITGYVQVESGGKATFGQYKEGKWVPNEPDGKLELLPGERVVIYGLPVDTGYSFTITEDKVNGYVPTITGGDVDGYSVSGSVGAEGEAAATVTFKNVKQPIDPAYVSLSATKNLTNTNATGREKTLAAGDFTFVLAPVAGNPAGDPITGPVEVKNDAAGVVQLLSNEPYAQLGEYNYTVREVIPNPTAPGITYDTKIHTITVKIDPQGEGEHYTSHLQAKLKIDGGELITGTDEGGHYTFGPATIITFDNNYEPGIATAVLQARKLYLGGEMEGNEFTFTLTPVTAQVGDPESSPEPAENEEQGSDLEIAPPSNGGEQQEQPGAGDPADPEASASPEPSATAEPTPVTPAEPEASDAPEVDPNEQDGPSYTSLEPGDGTEGDPAPTDPDQEPAGDPAPDGSENTPAPDESEATETPAPTDTAAPSDTPEPSETPEPTDTAEPSETPEATQTPEATETPAGEPEGDPDDNEIMPVDLVPMDDADMPMPGGQKGGTAEGKNDKFGNVIFDSIKFTEPGIYYYKITEQPTGDNIEYDERVIFAKVIVTAVSDSEPKELTASVEYLSSMDEDHPGEADVPMTGTPQFTNINTEPVKTEPDPGPDMPVQVGDVVTYRVTWYNDKDVAATVTVRDRLDPGVTYNAGTAVAYRYVVDDAGNVTELQIGTGTYSSDDHAITWVLEKQPSMATGYVEFKVTVNENAKYKWDYSQEEEDTSAPPTGPNTVDDTTEDFRIVNRAALKIGDENWQWTEKIPNPTWEPEKDSEPKSGTTVHVGEHIFYWITWQNYLAQAAEITITDVLDPGLTYVEGTAMAYEGEHGAGGKPLNDTNGNQIRGIYDPYTRTIEWKLGTQDPNKFGYVMFEAEVNNDALQDDATVKNDATVKVGEHSFQTNEVEHYVDGRLLVTKYVSGNSGETTRDFHFTVTLTPPTEGDALTAWNNWNKTCVCTRNGEPVEDFAFTENDDGSYSATFTLRHNQTASINGLPVGAGYTVTETEVNTDGYSTNYERATGTIGSGDSTPHAVITNTKDVYTPPPGPDGTPEPSTTPTPSTSPSPSPTPDGQPHKVETDPGDGQMVVPDQWVTYEITWENTHAESATVTIWDTLDPNVEFVSASEGYTYDPATHTVTWVLPDRAGGSTGSVTVTVRVLPSAVQAGIIRNQAHVQVGDDPAQDTEIPENPLTPPSPSPVAPSPTPSSGIPDTGDSSRPGLWLALLTVSLMGLGLIGGATLRRRKRSK